MADINPLALIGRSQVGPSDNKALRDLQTRGAIANLNNASLEGRTRQMGIDDRRKTALGFGQNLGPSGEFDPSGLEKLETLRLGQNFGRDAKSWSDFRRGGGQFVLPKGGVPASELHTQKIISGDFPGQAKARVEAKAIEKVGENEEVSGVSVGGVDLLAQKYKRARSGESTREAKNTRQVRESAAKRISEADAQHQSPDNDPEVIAVKARMKAFVQGKNPGSVVGEPQVFPDGKVHIEIDGNDFIIEN